jgi:hypothetical protein
MIVRSTQSVSLRSIFYRIGPTWFLLDHYYRSTLNWRQQISRAPQVSLSSSDLASCAEVLLDDRSDRFRRFCPDCRDEPVHESFDELGLGWYAQVARCRRCGRQGMKVWALG